MSEKAPYEVPPARPFTEFLIKGLKEVEMMYGHVFTIRFIKHAVEFIFRKVGDKPSCNIENLEQLAEYVISKADKYPTPYAMVPYAQAKTENELQGYSGAGTTMEMVALSEDVAQGSKISEKSVDMDDVLQKLGQFLTVLQYSPKVWGYRINKDGSIDIGILKCFQMDGCRMAYNENVLKRRDGKLRCGIIHFVCGYFKLATGHVWDYDLLEYCESHCLVRSSIRYR
ncbi:MAG: hypothetical protein WED07_15785 [Candidatus Freyarchaeum deiterrae]